ncbi:Pyridoxal phosphate-dependent transferase major region subdomain 2 [Penicillium freii]|nr:Pyridoxal phosphate-dependent transferase major region subdomain 2 [Penicillium freii]
MEQASMEPVISHRARSACHDTVSNPMWDVLDDAWCPSTNLTGYINVGVAENALMQDDLLDFINTTNLDLPAKYLTYN